MTLTMVPRIVLAMEEALRCSGCGDAIGTYEPVVVIGPAGARGTSLAREPEVGGNGERILHRTCAEAGRAESVGLSAAEAARLPH
jgi:hypothetical protein